MSVVSVACSEPEDKFTSADVQATVEASVLQDRQLEATSEAKVQMMVEATVQAISSEKTPTKEIVLTSTSIPNPTSTQIPTPLPNKKSSNLSTLGVIPTKIPTPTPIPVPMNAAEVYDLVSESIVFVESPIFTGSGILLNNNYVITNAHIIWPHEMADITLTSGKTYKDVPLVKQDFALDLSLLGPLDLDQSNRNLNISSGEDLPIGSDVFLIGYPGESVRKENPSITQGIISNFKEYKPRETTLILTDANIGGGQSGGAIISEDGSVLGVTGWYMREAMDEESEPGKNKLLISGIFGVAIISSLVSLVLIMHLLDVLIGIIVFAMSSLASYFLIRFVLGIFVEITSTMTTITLIFSIIFGVILGLVSHMFVFDWIASKTKLSIFLKFRY